MITVFTTNTCGYCKMVKQYLTLKGKDFTEINLNENPEKHQEIIEKTGAMTVPVTQIIKDGVEEFIIGWNREKFAGII
jgi:glutaredoxin 3